MNSRSTTMKYRVRGTLMCVALLTAATTTALIANEAGAATPNHSSVVGVNQLQGVPSNSGEKKLTPAQVYAAAEKAADEKAALKLSVAAKVRDEVLLATKENGGSQVNDYVNVYSNDLVSIDHVAFVTMGTDTEVDFRAEASAAAAYNSQPQTPATTNTYKVAISKAKSNLASSDALAETKASASLKVTQSKYDKAALAAATIGVKSDAHAELVYTHTALRIAEERAKTHRIDAAAFAAASGVKTPKPPVQSPARAKYVAAESQADRVATSATRSATRKLNDSLDGTTASAASLLAIYTSFTFDVGNGEFYAQQAASSAAAHAQGDLKIEYNSHPQTSVNNGAFNAGEVRIGDLRSITTFAAADAMVAEQAKLSASYSSDAAAQKAHGKISDAQAQKTFSVSIAKVRAARAKAHAANLKALHDSEHQGH